MPTPKKKKPQHQTDPERPRQSPPEKPDAVEEASEESFPASDAPSWEPLHPGKPAKHPDRR